MERHEIAVVIPVYHAEKYLKQCVKSILRQSFQKFALVLVDDGSTDQSGAICDFLAAKDERVHVIHQSNRGSAEARKAGIFSVWAQQAKYILLSDADDRMEKDALQKLYDYAEQNQLDCVCANMAKMWSGIALPSRYKAPCFHSAQIYENDEIMERLYISCFGFSNYPVTLVAKLYRRELITKAVDFAPIVRFMGDDLSVTLRCLPETKRLGILPDIVYFYRFGGGTSKYMPYMLEDFLSLYRCKRELLVKHPMPQDAKCLISIELMNILATWFRMYQHKGGHTEAELLAEIERVSRLTEVRDAISVLEERKKRHLLAEQLKLGSFREIEKQISRDLKRDRPKRVVKRLLGIG